MAAQGQDATRTYEDIVGWSDLSIQSAPDLSGKIRERLYPTGDETELINLAKRKGEEFLIAAWGESVGFEQDETYQLTERIALTLDFDNDINDEKVTFVFHRPLPIQLVWSESTSEFDAVPYQVPLALTESDLQAWTALYGDLYLSNIDVIVEDTSEYANAGEEIEIFARAAYRLRRKLYKSMVKAKNLNGNYSKNDYARWMRTDTVIDWILESVDGSLSWDKVMVKAGVNVVQLLAGENERFLPFRLSMDMDPYSGWPWTTTLQRHSIHEKQIRLEQLCHYAQKEYALNTNEMVDRLIKEKEYGKGTHDVLRRFCEPIDALCDSLESLMKRDLLGLDALRGSRRYARMKATIDLGRDVTQRLCHMPQRYEHAVFPHIVPGPDVLGPVQRTEAQRRELQQAMDQVNESEKKRKRDDAFMQGQAQQMVPAKRTK